MQKLLLEKTPEFDLLYSSGKDFEGFFLQFSLFYFDLDFCGTSFSAVIPVSEVNRNRCAVFGSTISQFLASQSTSIVYQEAHKQVWSTIGNICGTAIDCNELWKDETKSLGKRRALAHLLKLLDGYGLSKHRTTFLEAYMLTLNFYFSLPT